MKTNLLKPFFLVSCAFIGTNPASAQVFTTLHSFTATGTSICLTNIDGAGSDAGLVLSGNRLYGTALLGGTSGNGTVFALNIDGTAFTNLHNFSESPFAFPNVTNVDGARPYAGLIVSGNTLYGTTQIGGTNGNGTLFAMKPDGTGFTNLHNFIPATGNPDGGNPYAGLTLSSNILYGTTATGGIHGYGMVFAVNTDGTSFTNLHSFFNAHDGANPYAGLTLSSNRLYGTALAGGIWGNGSIFALNTDGTGFTNLHFFKLNDGVNPYAALVLSGKTLYGTTAVGGVLGYGTVFALNIDGTGFTNLHSFNRIDGWEPQSKLILSGKTLYGTTAYGGKNGNGTVFAITIDGTAFVTLHDFTAVGISEDGGYPIGELVLSGNTLYGTTHQGGSANTGTVFSLVLPPPQLTITRSGLNLNLTWPTNATGFTLQSATNLGSSAVWTSTAAAPVVVDEQNTVTSPISGAIQFFRLSH